MVIMTAGTAFAQIEKLPTDTVGGLSIKVVFKHRGGAEEVNSFKTFTQNTGYWLDRNEIPSFT